jgi:large subunit ribosomal protein L7e
VISKYHIEIHFFRVVPELVKKKEARDADLKKKTEEARAKRKTLRQDKQKEIIAKSEKWYKEYLEERKKTITEKRAAKLAGNYYVPAEPKVAFVIRIKG